MGALVAAQLRHAQLLEAQQACSPSIQHAHVTLLRPGRAVEVDQQCPDAEVPVQGMVEAWQGMPRCAHLMDQYGMQYSRAFANLCNAGHTVSDLQSVLAEVPACSAGSFVLAQA